MITVYIIDVTWMKAGKLIDQQKGLRIKIKEISYYFYK